MSNTERRKQMRFFWLLAIAMLATSSLFAQGFGGRQGSGAMTTLMLNTPKGLFTLRSGVLAKYDLATLQPVKTLALFGAAPELPAGNAQRADRDKYYAEIAKRNAPAIMLTTKDGGLIIVIGDGFARINQDTLKVDASSSLVDPKAPPVDPNAPRAIEPVPGYLLVDTTLYLMRGKEMLAVNTTDGKVSTRSALPKELLPLPMPSFQRGGGGPGGGGGNPGGG